MTAAGAEGGLAVVVVVAHVPMLPAGPAWQHLSGTSAVPDRTPRRTLPAVRWFRRHERIGFPDAWRALLDERMVHWSYLDDAERARLEDVALDLLEHVAWEGAKGFELTEEVQVLIAAQAGLLAVGLDGDPYPRVGPIIVHPSTVVLRGQRAGPAPGLASDGPFPILGQAAYRGPVIIAWDAARRAARHPERGHNVVYHEFAHQLDMLDGVIDGTPPLPDAAAGQRWVEVCTREYEAVRAGTAGPLLDPYAGTNVGEFFAVATEVFFDLPRALEADKPELYDVLRGFYRQDPAARERRAGARP